MYFFCAVFKDEKSDSTQQDAIGKRQTFEQSRPRSCFYLHFFLLAVVHVPYVCMSLSTSCHFPTTLRREFFT